MDISKRFVSTKSATNIPCVTCQTIIFRKISFANLYRRPMFDVYVCKSYLNGGGFISALSDKPKDYVRLNGPMLLREVLKASNTLKYYQVLEANVVELEMHYVICT